MKAAGETFPEETDDYGVREAADAVTARVYFLPRSQM